MALGLAAGYRFRCDNVLSASVCDRPTLRVDIYWPESKVTDVGDVKFLTATRPLGLSEIHS